MTKTFAALNTGVIRFDVRQSADALLRRIEEALPAVSDCAESLDDFRKLIDRRDAARFEASRREEYDQLCRQIDERAEPFGDVDREIRGIAMALRDFLARLPERPEDVRSFQRQMQRAEILKAIDCSLWISKALALRELQVIRDHLKDFLGRPDRPTPAEVVDSRREELGLTIEGLAAAAGVNKKQIYAIKRGDNTTIETLRCVAGALGCEPGDLIQPAKNRS